MKIDCAYCDGSFLEQLTHCPHCGHRQMDLLLHAELVVRDVEFLDRLESFGPKLAILESLDEDAQPRPAVHRPAD